jgi:hypothetical protein
MTERSVTDPPVNDLSNEELEEYLAQNEDTLSQISGSTNRTTGAIARTLNQVHLEHDQEANEMEIDVTGISSDQPVESPEQKLDEPLPVEININQWSSKNRTQPVQELSWAVPNPYIPFDQESDYYPHMDSEQPVQNFAPETHAPETIPIYAAQNISYSNIPAIPANEGPVKIIATKANAKTGIQKPAPLKLFSNIFQISPRFDSGNFEFQESELVENARGRPKRVVPETGQVIQDDAIFVENLKTRQRRCRNNLMSKEMSPARFLYNLGDSGNSKDGGFAVPAYSYTKYLAMRCAELNNYGLENRLCSPYGDTKAYLMLSVCCEIMKSQPVNNKWWGEIIVSSKIYFLLNIGQKIISKIIIFNYLSHKDAILEFALM